VPSSIRYEMDIMQDSLIGRFFGLALDPLVRLSRTRVNYWLEFVLDTALGMVFLMEAVLRHARPLAVVSLVLLGLFVFSFIEYFFHRWLFHGSLRLMAQGHAAHHGDPRGYDSLPFFLPALVLTALSGLAMLVMSTADALLLSSGIALGYVTYGLSHFLIHHMRFRRAFIRKWAAYHHIHHYHPDRNYGVTTPLWDILLGTRYVPTQQFSGPRPGVPSS
jgi:sterol desaturase/sphingolipid hydroxylase (fatty acid hydroxylase superfamily)